MTAAWLLVGYAAMGLSLCLAIRCEAKDGEWDAQAYVVGAFLLWPVVIGALLLAKFLRWVQR